MDHIKQKIPSSGAGGEVLSCLRAIKRECNFALESLYTTIRSENEKKLCEKVSGTEGFSLTYHRSSGDVMALIKSICTDGKPRISMIDVQKGANCPENIPEGSLVLLFTNGCDRHTLSVRCVDSAGCADAFSSDPDEGWVWNKSKEESE